MADMEDILKKGFEWVKNAAGEWVQKKKQEATDRQAKKGKQGDANVMANKNEYLMSKAIDDVDVSGMSGDKNRFKQDSALKNLK
jgi:hypothetical protein